MGKCAQLVDVLLLLCLFTIKQVWTATVFIAANQTILLTKIGDRGIIQSAGFPLKCCEQQYITLQLGVLAAQLNAYIHLMFTDLDLPFGTNFKIYKAANELPQNMFLQQPTYKYGMWQRPFITSTKTGQVIHLVLTPAKQTYYNTSFYCGFRASYIVKKSEIPYYRMTSELCPPIASVVEGSRVTIKPEPTARFSEKWLDCVWHIKTPEGSISFGHNEEDQFRTYIRITEAKLSRGHIEIHRGRMSTSPEMAKGKTLTDLRQPEEGFTGYHGFYIHVFMPADDRQNKFSFIYGVIHYLSTGAIGGCDVGFQCPNNLNWCLPKRNVCNRVHNCPDGADERSCDKQVLMTSSVTNKLTTPQSISTTVGVEKSPCASWLHDCGDGRCLLMESDCDSNIGKGGCSYMSKLCPDGQCVFIFDTCPGQCAIFEKECSDGSCVSSIGFCPDDPCPGNRPNRCNNNYECYSETDRCDDYNDCTDGTDEENCYLGVHVAGNEKLYSLLLIPVLIILCAYCCYCCRKKSISDSPQPDPPHTGPRMFPVTPHQIRTNSHNNHSPSIHCYTAIGTGTYTDTNIELSELPDDNRNVSRLEPTAPPPSYEEVLNTDLYLLGGNHIQTEAPPPSYDTAVQSQHIDVL